MPRHNLRSPIGVLVVGLILIWMLLIRSAQSTSAIGDLQPYPGYPAQTTPTTAANSTAPATLPTTTATTNTLATAIPTATKATAITTRVPTRPLANNAPAATPVVPTATALPVLVSELTCAPGATIEINGESPPRAALLLYFGQRVVGGASADPNGRFVIPLIVGRERAGEYVVTVRVRGTRQLVRELTCIVPQVSPTPLPTPYYRVRG